MSKLVSLPATDLLYRRWPAPEPKAVLLLVHGLGAHSARWDSLGEYFTRKGFSSYALELKGFGQTPDRPRGHITSFRTYYQDILELRQAIGKEHPDKKVFLLGESMGALIAFLLACRQPGRFAGQVLISPAFQNAMKFSPSAYLKIAAFLLLNTKMTITMPFNSAMCTRDTAYQKIMDNNPDELRVASIKTLLNILWAQIQAKRLAKELVLPSLFLIPGQDTMINAAVSRQVFTRLRLKDKRLIEYPEMRHALSIELDREKVFADILNWLEKRL
jgi:alpha-beta hydrolase superfamily lysophospholipase